MLEISKIRIDGGTQPRVELNNDIVEEYKQAYLDGTEFPPVTVFYDGSSYWLADGFHRYWAVKAADKTSIYEHIIPGTQREAVLYSLGANASHGLRRTNADKRNAVMKMLNDSEWTQLSDREIAKQCGVSHPFVGEIRRSLVTVTSDNQKTTERTYTTKHGTQATMQVSNIGKSNLDTNNRAAQRRVAVPPKNAAEIKAKLKDAEKERVRQSEIDEGKQSEDIPEFVDDDELQERLADLEIYYKLLEEDDKLKAATEEIKRLKAVERVMQSRINGLMAEKSEAIKAAKKYQRQVDRLKKEMANV